MKKYQGLIFYDFLFKKSIFGQSPAGGKELKGRLKIPHARRKLMWTRILRKHITEVRLKKTLIDIRLNAEEEEMFHFLSSCKSTY
jgi:hypothetical protein